MKKKDKDKVKRKPLNEFRYNYNERYINYIFEEEGNKYHSLGITHKSKTFGKKNMPLDNNPQKNKTEKSYIRNGVITDTKNNYSKKDNRFSFSSSDYPKVKAKIRNFKKKRKKVNKKTNVFAPGINTRRHTDVSIRRLLINSICQ